MKIVIRKKRLYRVLSFICLTPLILLVVVFLLTVVLGVIGPLPAFGLEALGVNVPFWPPAEKIERDFLLLISAIAWLAGVSALGFKLNAVSEDT